MSSSSSNRMHGHMASNIYDLDVALSLNQGSYDPWTDSQHYHYDHHDYHEMAIRNITNYASNTQQNSAQDMSSGMMFHDLSAQSLQGSLNGPGKRADGSLPYELCLILG
jgi:hypothetical protein